MHGKEEIIYMKKNGSFILRLVFGLMGTVYVGLGLVFLVVATKAAGSIARIFTLPEEELAFAINGVVFTVLGVAFLVVTGILILVGRKQQRMQEELLQYGTRVTGVVVDVRINHSIRVNRKSPLVARVKCLMPTGEITLKSRNLWNACPNTGDPVEVIYDPMNEKRYVIEFADER